jgi:mycothiol synthase
MKMKLRPYRDEQDLEDMRLLLIESRKAAGPVYYIHPGDLNWWLYYLDQDFQNRIYLWEDENYNQLVSWVLFSPNFGAFDVFVTPDPGLCEQRMELFVWAEEQMRRLVGEQGGADLRTMWVSEYDHELIAHLEKRGFACSDYHLVYLQQPLDEVISKPELPQGYFLGTVAGEQELAQRALVSYAAFGSSKPIADYIERYLRFMRSPVYKPEWDLVIVAPSGEFAAFCVGWLDEENQLGYFEPVGTHPNFRRRGLAAAVLREGLCRMQARGLLTASVYVESDNPLAKKLYEGLGFRKIHKLLTYVKLL